ncbi:IS3 family transposase, partial [Vibrio crassostreae]|uniref:IS3 family transposase n=1 Tax=Vibrio crassostreae TaxID=246167 RepID=UPI001E613CB2
MWTNEWSLTHTSAVLNLSSPGILSVWLKRFNELGIKGLKMRQKGRPSMKQQPQRTTKPDNEMLEELKGVGLLTNRECRSKKVGRVGAGKKPSNKEKAVIALTLKGKYPLKHLLHTLQLAKSVFYYQAQTSKRPNSYERELRLIKSIYHEHKGRYGYRRIHLELKNQGFALNHKTVQRLMAQLNLKSTVRIKKYRSYRGESGTAAPNVLERDFSATQPDEKWVTDVTEFKVKEQKVYLSPVVDLFTQEVVAYRVAKNACLPLVTDMLTEAISTLKPNSKPIIHSDQGWQYRHRQYQKKVAESGLTQSMSRKGNCLD